MSLDERIAALHNKIQSTKDPSFRSFLESQVTYLTWQKQYFTKPSNNIPVGLQFTGSKIQSTKSNTSDTCIDILEDIFNSVEDLF